MEALGGVEPPTKKRFNCPKNRRQSQEALIGMLDGYNFGKAIVRVASHRGLQLMTTKRCTWVSMDNPLMLQYHDSEWGVPVHDDRKHFEFLVLEAAQAGLSWSIVLKKREGYRRAFSEFDPKKVARYTERRIQKLTLDSGIIRNRMKIEAAIRNAQAFLAIQEEFGSFDAYCWRFVDGRPKLNRWKTMRQIPATSHESDAFSKDLKHRGFSFVGSTVVYAHMQAVGMVNDHLVDCFRYREIRGLDSLPARPRSSRTASTA
jgi:DNA-3-methyladenine glycosylase I